jgi:hypothetical protein
MKNNKTITYLVVAVLALSVVYLGNKVLNTTPKLAAKGATQYKVVFVVEQNQAGMEKELNKNAKDGWTFAASDQPYLILEK